MAARQEICYIDTGGTFTDVFLMNADKRISFAKVPTTPRNLSECFFTGLEKAASELGLADTGLLSQLKVLGYGSTIAITALLTGSGARVGLITTRGFEDTMIMMRGKAGWVGLTHEEKMHVITQKKPEPLVPRELIRGVTERVDILGKVVLPVREEEARRAARELLEAGVEVLTLPLRSPRRTAEREEVRANLWGRLDRFKDIGGRPGLTGFVPLWGWITHLQDAILALEIIKNCWSNAPTRVLALSRLPRRRGLQPGRSLSAPGKRQSKQSPHGTLREYSSAGFYGGTRATGLPSRDPRRKRS